MTNKINLNLVMALLFTTAIISCKKDSSSPVVEPVKSKLELLTANVYIYQSVFNNWGLANQSLVYTLGSSSNTQDWSKSRLKFYRDGSFDEVLTTGIWRQGSWSLNSDSTLLTTSGGGFSNTATIEKLVTDTIIWRDNVNKSRGIQIAKR